MNQGPCDEPSDGKESEDVHNKTTESRLTPRMAGVLLAGIALVMCVVLRLMGRVWWCEAGDLVPWSFDIWSTHNSQHLVDPYALSHIEHGIGLSVLLAVAIGSKCSLPLRTIIVALFEAAWEIAENTPWMIQRYREATISLDYFGDSILNSLSDFGMCLAGVWIARVTNLRTAVAIFVALEIISTIWIRDSLLINILMLTWPIDAIKDWQAVLAPQ